MVEKKDVSLVDEMVDLRVVVKVAVRVDSKVDRWVRWAPFVSS